MTITYDKLFIGGEWRAPASTNTIAVHSASTEEFLGSVPEAVEADVDAAVSAARAAFDDPAGWSTWAPEQRADAMERLAGILEARSDELARRVSSQNGMPISISSQLEVGFPQMLLGYYAGLIRNTPLEEVRHGLLAGNEIRVRRLPIGVVAAIVPWNFPMALTMFKMAPAFAMGCTMVVKPSPETVLDAQLLAEAVHEAGIPAGVYNVVPAGREVGAYLVQHPGIDKVAFTGSTAAGRAIGEVCGRLLRPCTLELGGKSASILLDDVDLPASLEDLFSATMLNSGQACYLGTRILAPANRYDEVVDTLTSFVGSLKVGDALDPETMIGPMSSSRHRERVESYIAKGKGDGARVTTGGGRPADLDRGWFVQPTVFAEVDNNSTIAQEEIFGPVLTVIRYSGDDEAVRIANDSAYGLGGSVWTSDPERGASVAVRIRTGTIGVNSYLPDPVAPFGGVKDSGLGREMGPEGLASYQSLQSVYL